MAFHIMHTYGLRTCALGHTCHASSSGGEGGDTLFAATMVDMFTAPVHHNDTTTTITKAAP
jgi:hypothetical protein